MIIKTSKSGVPLALRRQTQTEHSKVYFRCEDGGGLIDVISGVQMIPTQFELNYNSARKSYYTNMVIGSTQEPTNKSFPTFRGDRAFMALVCGYATDGDNFRFAIGKQGDDTIGVGLVRDHCAVKDDAQASDLLASLTPKILGNVDNASTVNVQNRDIFGVLRYEPGSGVTTFAYYDTNTGALLEDSSNLSTLTIGDFTPAPFMRFSGMELTTAVYYSFDGTTTPADWYRAAWWTAVHAAAGDRYLYAMDGW